MDDTAQPPSTRYQQIVDLIRHRIETNTLKPGDKLPSVRKLHRLTGFSMTTIHHAYSLLEGDGIIVARPRSGFFVVESQLEATADAAAEDNEIQSNHLVSVDEMAFRVTSLWHRHELEAFGAIYPSRDLGVRQKIDQHIRQILRVRGRAFPEMDSPEGDPLLREVIARRAVLKGIIVRPADVAILGRGIQGLDLCIEVLTAPGDLVLIESPSFFPVFAALQRRQLRAVEIYSHPKTGIDADQFRHLLHNNPVKACILMPVHHYPTGITYSAETMQSVVTTANRMDVPIIEIDLFGELTHCGETMSSLKQYDTKDQVLHFSTLGGLLAYGYGVSSVISPRYQPILTQRQFMAVLSSGEGIIQHGIAEYIIKSGYDRHLRQVRAMLAERINHGLQLIAENFPAACTVHRPMGGFMCWVRGPRNFDSMKASRIAFTNQISLPPGPMFSVTNSFGNFIALNLSLPWTEERIRKLKIVASLMRD
ncbi:aminotransferase-like domain-containing protein [Pseudochelatococcus sp. B33]